MENTKSLRERVIAGREERRERILEKKQKKKVVNSN